MSNNQQHQEVCKHCKEGEIDRDADMVVCTSCGWVVEDRDQLRYDDLQTFDLRDPDKAFLSGLKLTNNVKHHHLNRKYQTQSKESAKRFLETLTVNFCLTKEMKEEVRELFKKAISERYFCSWGSTRVVVSAVCIYVTVCQAGRPTTVSEVCNVAGISNDEFARVFYSFLKEFPEANPKRASQEYPNSPEQAPMNVLVEHVLRELEFDPTECREINRRTTKLVEIQKNMELIEGCTDMEGKSPLRLIVAASFFAWKSMDVQLRRRVSLIQFAKTHKVNNSQMATVRSRIGDLIKSFVNLTSKLSWLRNKDIDKKNICLYLDDILNGSDGLIGELKFDAYRKRRVTGRPVLPKPAKVKPPAPVLDESNDPDISDSEIDNYIRSAKEVVVIEKVKRKLEKVEHSSSTCSQSTKRVKK